MQEILKILQENPAVEAIIEKQNGLGNLSLSEEALLIASAFQRKKRNIVVVKQNLYTAQKLYERLQALTDAKVLLFSVEESLRVEAIARSPEMRASQIEVMASLLVREPCICITHTAGVMHYTSNPDVFQKHSIHLKLEDEISFEHLKKLLFEAGYSHVSRVDQPLCYAARGGIIDVYSMNHDQPIRIEFFDNIIESIRFFDISTQRTVQILDEITIVPASDMLVSDEEIKEITEKVNKDLMKYERQLSGTYRESLISTIHADMDDLCNHIQNGNLYKYYTYLKQTYTILDYIENPLVILSSDEEIKTSAKHIQEETISYMQEMSKEGLSLPKYSLFADPFAVCEKYEHITFAMFVDYKHPISSQILMQAVGDLPFEKIMEQIIAEAKQKKVVLCVTHKEREVILSYLQDHDISYHEIAGDQPLMEGVHLYQKDILEGFVLVKEGISVYSSKEIFHVQRKQTRYANKFKEAEALHDYMELVPGDYVVHNQHGVGKYLGIVNKEIDGVHKDFLNIAYKGNDILLVPLEQFKLIRKFMSKEGASPKLNTLGSGEWEKTKRKVSSKIAELADRLISLYALREDNIGYAFSPDTPFQRQFEDDFEFELTRDQEKAVMEIKRDMESHKPMDRLLCGDVGFGKTEVAIRAAFKAVVDEKQVAFLCPTTILSLQHYKTFKKRFQDYPVNIAVLNRFISTAEAKKIKQDLKEGNIDILIGTHRILSKDIKFKDLGFLVIDEEQRFGVEHKEKIKELRSSVDVLSMSATPIPRTLQMSLIGIRSLSQLETPPLNRMPVQTYVIEKDFKIIKEIIQRELARDGQIFYLYNNVNEIYNVATKLRMELPDVEIGVAHGKMHRDEIEDVMLQFTNNQYQILVCTTIIETGIDIPNANTIIIDDADRFGLSQLYQIKGRVGRSDRLAYAYLMYSPQKNLTEIAMKRLKSIKEFTQLGSGYKIAMRDLTIRGAGDMLGPQQAGFIDTVGMDMYIEMLNSAIAERKGIKVEEAPVMKKANTKLDAYIPQPFAPEDYEKITLYQRIDEITNKRELLSFMEEIEDNYGKLPTAVQMLFEKKRLDILINEPHIENFRELPQGIELIFTEGWSNRIDGVKLFEMMTTLCSDAQIRYANSKITMKMPKRKNWLALVIEILERTLSMQVQESE